MRSETLILINDYDASSGASQQGAPDSAQQFPYFNMQSSVYGFDQNDAALILQGSLNGREWIDIDSISLPKPTTYALSALLGTHLIVVTGDCRTAIANNKNFYVNGSDSNDGRYTSSQANYKGQLDYSGISSGSFTVGHTVTGSSSGATGKIAVDDGTTLTLIDVTGIFTNSDTITESGTAKTADVDSVASVTTIVVEEDITAEAAAGNAWTAEQSYKQFDTPKTLWTYYRASFTPGTVSEGFLDAILLAKDYTRPE